MKFILRLRDWREQERGREVKMKLSSERIYSHICIWGETLGRKPVLSWPWLLSVRLAAMPATGKLEIQVQRNKETATATIDEM